MDTDATKDRKKYEAMLVTALAEARTGLAEGGIPIGAALFTREGKLLGKGHNRRVQKGSAILHGEMDALENTGRQSAAIYRECVLYTTLSPCSMCSGAIVLYKIPRVVVGDNKTFLGAEDYLRSQGVIVEVIQDSDGASSAKEPFDQMRSDKSGAACHQDLH